MQEIDYSFDTISDMEIAQGVWYMVREKFIWLRKLS